MEIYKDYWNAVRERVLNRDLACVSSMLALSDEGDYKFISERETVLIDIDVLKYYIEKDDEDSIVKAYEQFKLDLQSVLSEHCSSKLPEAEACAIALAWLSILQDTLSDYKKSSSLVRSPHRGEVGNLQVSQIL